MGIDAFSDVGKDQNSIYIYEWKLDLLSDEFKYELGIPDSRMLIKRIAFERFCASVDSK